MPDLPCGPPLPPLVILEFIGGAWDGMNLTNHSPDPVEAGLAVFVLQATRHGQVGRSVAVPSQYAIRSGGCTYEVTAHTTVFGERLVRLEVCEDDCGQSPALEGQAIVLHFSGGFLDGRCLRSDSPDLTEALLSTAYFGLTKQGSTGQRLQILPAVWRRLQTKLCGNAPVAEYRVVERSADEQTITVRLEYLPT